MKRFALSIIALLSLHAEQNCINIHASMKVTPSEIEEYRNSVPRNIIVADDQIVDALQKDRLFAAAMLKDAKGNDELMRSIELEVTTVLSRRYQNLLLENEKIPDEEAVYKSYYETHLDEFRTDTTMDILQAQFISKEDAKQFVEAYRKEPGIIQKYSKQINRFEQIPIEKALPLYSLHLNHLESGIPTDPIPLNGKQWFVLIKSNVVSAGTLPYEKVKETIRRKLIQIKQKEILDQSLEKLKGSK